MKNVLSILSFCSVHVYIFYGSVNTGVPPIASKFETSNENNLLVFLTNQAYQNLVKSATRVNISLLLSYKPSYSSAKKAMNTKNESSEVTLNMLAQSMISSMASHHLVNYFWIVNFNGCSIITCLL